MGGGGGAQGHHRVRIRAGRVGCGRLGDRRKTGAGAELQFRLRLRVVRSDLYDGLARHRAAGQRGGHHHAGRLRRHRSRRVRVSGQPLPCDRAKRVGCVRAGFDSGSHCHGRFRVQRRQRHLLERQWLGPGLHTGDGVERYRTGRRLLCHRGRRQPLFCPTALADRSRSAKRWMAASARLVVSGLPRSRSRLHLQRRLRRAGRRHILRDADDGRRAGAAEPVPGPDTPRPGKHQPGSLPDGAERTADI